MGREASFEQAIPYPRSCAIAFASVLGSWLKARRSRFFLAVVEESCHGEGQE